MNTEEKAKAYDEALDKAKKELQTCGSTDCDAARQIFRFFPELRESEDERIRKALIDGVRQIRCKNGITQEQMLAYLEKQKDASKAIEAVDRIDKYIDEHLANAHDMKDSNPDKKYYRGWDDALGKMAGILQDVYSGEKQKESLRDFIDNFPYSDEQKEPHHTKRNALFDECVKNCDSEVIKKVSDEIDKMLQKEQKPNYCHYGGDPSIERCKYCSVTCSARLMEEQKPIDYEVELKKCKDNPLYFFDKYVKVKLKPAEWSEDIIRKAVKEVGLTQHQIDWFKTNVFPPKQEWNDEDEGELQNAIDALEFLGKKGVYKSESGYDAALQAASWLKSYKSQLKQGWTEDYRKENIQTRFAFYTYKDDPSVLYLSNVFVEKTSRNHGFGTRILKAAENVAETLGATSIRLKVKQDNPANVWYWKHGYNYMTSEDGYDWLEKNLKYLKPKKSIKWSGDDELMIESLIAYLKGTGQDFISNDMVYWLKSLPERFNLQPKQEWSEEEKDKLNSIERIIVNANAHGNYLIGDKEAIDLQHFIRSIVKPTTNLAEWSENDKLHYVSVLNALEYVKGCKSDYDKIEAVKSDIAWLRELPERFNLPPKQEWSEEDEENFKWFDKFFRAESVVSGGKDIPQDKYLWFKSRRPQPKQEWSEEDEEMLNSCICSIEESKENRYAYKETDGDTYYDHEIAWLKSLRPSWKPSKEQMEALEEVAYNLVGTGTDTDVYLVQLYEQLKKLI